MLTAYPRQEFHYLKNAICYVEILKNHKYWFVIVTEAEDNNGMSICNAFETLFLNVCNIFSLPYKDVVWIEHWEAWEGRISYSRDTEDFMIVSASVHPLTKRVYNPHWQLIANDRNTLIKALNQHYS